MEVRREGDGRFVVEGELDVSNAEQLGEVLWADLRAGSSVVVGLSGLAFMDSQGLRLFLRLALHAEQRGLGPGGAGKPLARRSSDPGDLAAAGHARPGGAGAADLTEE